MTRRVEDANIIASTTESHNPEYPYDLVEEINARHERNDEVEVVEVSVTNNDFMNDSDDDDSIDHQITRVADQNVTLNETSEDSIPDPLVNEGGVSSVTNPISGHHRASARDVNRKVPFPSVSLEEGRNNGYQMMKEAKRIGWDNSLKFGKRSVWLKEKQPLWFGVTGIFRMYRPVNHSRLSAHLHALFKFAKDRYPSENHSNDSTGLLGEDIPSYVLLCREWDDHKSSNPSTNVQQQANRFVTAVVQQQMLEPRRPLGETGSNLRSQVRDENPPAPISNLPTASNIMRDRSRITELVQNSGVPSGAATAAATGVRAAMSGMASVSRRDVISHIELSRERQSIRLCESLGSVLNTILHPPRTIADINSDFRDASAHFENASDESIAAYWRMAMDKLMDELRRV